MVGVLVFVLSFLLLSESANALLTSLPSASSFIAQPKFSKCGFDSAPHSLSSSWPLTCNVLFPTSLSRPLRGPSFLPAVSRSRPHSQQASPPPLPPTPLSSAPPASFASAPAATSSAAVTPQTATSILALDVTNIVFSPKIAQSHLTESSSSPGGGDHQSQQHLWTNAEFIRMFRGSGGYIARHRGAVLVVHIPGELLEDNYRAPMEYGNKGSLKASASDGGVDGNGQPLSSVLAGLTDDVALAWLLGVKLVLVVGCRPQVESRLRSLRQSARERDAQRLQEAKKEEEERLRLAAQATGSVGWLDNSAWIEPYNTREIREAMGEDVPYDNEFENGKADMAAEGSSEDGDGGELSREAGANSTRSGSGQKVMGAYDVSGVRITDKETLRIVKEEAGFARFEVERMLTRAMKNSGRSQYNSGSEGYARSSSSSSSNASPSPSSSSASSSSSSSATSSPFYSSSGAVKSADNGVLPGNSIYGSLYDGSVLNSGNAASSSSSSSRSSSSLPKTSSSDYGDADRERESSDAGLPRGNVVSGNFYSAQPLGVRNGLNYEYSGLVRRVESGQILSSLNRGDVVVLTSLGVSPSGEMFNVMSEGLAAVVAGAIKANKIIYYMSNGNSLKDRRTDKVIQSLRLSDAKSLLAHNGGVIKPWAVSLPERDLTLPPEETVVTPAKDPSAPDAVATVAHNQPMMAPHKREALDKIGWSIAALQNGVKRAHLISACDGALLQELYTREGSGTLISRDVYDGIRRANVDDIAGIEEIIRPLVEEGALLERSRDVLERDISTYHVFTRDGMIVGCGQLKVWDANGSLVSNGGGRGGGDSTGEIGCLVVHKDYRKGGRGDAILGYLERLAMLEHGVSKVFVMSTVTMEWFTERGFKEGNGLDGLPEGKKSRIDVRRGSRVYWKDLWSERELDADELLWDR